MKKREADVRRGWNLVPVVVASVDISENTEISFDLITQRSVPEQFVTSSVVKPDDAIRIVGHKLVVPVKAGDMMLWTELGMTPASAQH